MSALTGSAAAAPEREAVRTVGGWVWFAVMLGGWVVFFSLIAFSASTLRGLFTDLRELPLVVELLIWFLTFPFALALAVWETGWEEATRFALVVAIAVAWSAMFFPRKHL